MPIVKKGMFISTVVKSYSFVLLSPVQIVNNIQLNDY